jgi:hypothetical protein
MHLQAAAAEDFVQFYLYEGMDDSAIVPTPLATTSGHAHSAMPLAVQRSDYLAGAALTVMAGNRHPGFVL